MKKLSQFFYSKSTLIVALILTALTFLYMYFVMMEAAKGFELSNSNIKTLGLSFGFDLEMVQTYLSSRSTEMVRSYKEFNSIWDNIVALLYGLMYVAWLSLLFKSSAKKFGIFNLFPLAQSIFDWLENFKLSQIVDIYLENGQIDASDVQIASVFCMVKWVCSGVIFVLIIIGVILAVRSAMKRKRS